MSAARSGPFSAIGVDMTLPTFGSTATPPQPRPHLPPIHNHPHSPPKAFLMRPTSRHPQEVRTLCDQPQRRRQRGRLLQSPNGEAPVRWLLRLMRQLYLDLLFFVMAWVHTQPSNHRPMHDLPSGSPAFIEQQAKVLQSFEGLTVRPPTPIATERALREWIDLLVKAVPATALFAGFSLMLVYAVMERQFPRITPDATFALIALSCVGLLAVLLLSFVFLVPSGLASGANPKRSWHGNVDVFVFLFIFFGLCLGFWHGAYVALDWLTSTNLERSVFARITRASAGGHGYFMHVWLFPWIYTLSIILCVAGILYVLSGWIFASNQNEPSKLFVIGRRAVLVLVLVLGGFAVTSLHSFVSITRSLWTIILLLALTVGVAVIVLLATLMVRFVNRKRPSPLEINSGPLATAGVCFAATAVLVVQLLHAKWAALVPSLYFAIAFASAWAQAAPRPPKPLAHQLIYIGLIGFMFAILSPIIAPTCMRLLGFGNRTATQITLRTGDYEAIRLETKDLPQPDSTRPVTNLRNIHVVYDLGGEIVVRLHDDHGAPLLWPIPREKIVGVIWSSHN